MRGASWWLNGKESACQCRSSGLSYCSGKIPHAAKPVQQNSWASAPWPGSPDSWAHMLQLQEKPPQWEAHGLQPEGSPCLPHLEKSLQSNEDPVQPKKIQGFWPGTWFIAGIVQKEEWTFCILLLPTLRSEQTLQSVWFAFNPKLGRNGTEISWGEKSWNTIDLSSKFLPN